MSHHVYILKCADDSYYVGMTADVERRVKEHQKGYRHRSYTSTRRPVELVWSGEFATRAEAIQIENRIKNWSRAGKDALIHGARDLAPGTTRRKNTRRPGKKKPGALA